MLPIFYTSPENIKDDEAILIGEEARHLYKVLRLTKGEAVTVVDGRGNGYRSQIELISDKEVRCRIFAPIRNFGEPLHYVTLAAGLSTGSKFDEVIEKGTELGISRFVPLITQKSKIRADEEGGSSKKTERWRKVAIAAMKQCGRSVIPDIVTIIQFDNLFKLPNLGQVILFDPSSTNTPFEDYKLDAGQKYFTLVVGPESGFSAAELDLTREKGAALVSLGTRVLTDGKCRADRGGAGDVSSQGIQIRIQSADNVIDVDLMAIHMDFRVGAGNRLFSECVDIPHPAENRLWNESILLP